MPISLFGSKSSSEHSQPVDMGLLGSENHVTVFVFRIHHLHARAHILNKCVNEQDGGCCQNVFKSSAEGTESKS